MRAGPGAGQTKHECAKAAQRAPEYHWNPYRPHNSSLYRLYGTHNQAALNQAALSFSK